MDPWLWLSPLALLPLPFLRTRSHCQVASSVEVRTRPEYQYEPSLPSTSLVVCQPRIFPSPAHPAHTRRQYYVVASLGGDKVVSHLSYVRGHGHILRSLLLYLYMYETPAPSPTRETECLVLSPGHILVVVTLSGLCYQSSLTHTVLAG